MNNTSFSQVLGQIFAGLARLCWILLKWSLFAVVFLAMVLVAASKPQKNPYC